MSQTAIGAANAGRAGRPLGVIEAIQMARNLICVDFWPLWVCALLAMMIPAFAGPLAIVVGPPMAAGLFYVLGMRISGQKVEIGKVFEGFSQRFKQSFMAGLVPYGAGLAAGLLWVPVHLAIIFGMFGLTAATDERNAPVVFFPLLCVDFMIFGVLTLAALVVRLFFIFAQCAVWDHPESGWEAAKRSARMVWGNLGSVIGLLVLFWLIGVAGTLVGLAACCIGVYFTMPVVDLWYSATVLHLYRSWTGRPLAQGA